MNLIIVEGYFISVPMRHEMVMDAIYSRISGRAEADGLAVVQTYDFDSEIAGLIIGKDLMPGRYLEGSATKVLTQDKEMDNIINKYRIEAESIGEEMAQKHRLDYKPSINRGVIVNRF